MFAGTITGLIQVASGTNAEWEATTDVIPKGVMCHEEDTLGIRVGNGVNLYKDLLYTVDPKNPPQS